MQQFYSLERDQQMACEETYVNMLQLYTLTPGSISAFRDIRLCNEMCPPLSKNGGPLSEHSMPEETLSEEPQSVETLSVEQLSYNIVVKEETWTTKAEYEKEVLEDPLKIFELARAWTVLV